MKISQIGSSWIPRIVATNEKIDRITGDNFGTIDMRTRTRVHHDAIGRVIGKLAADLDETIAEQNRLSEEIAKLAASQVEIEALIKAYRAAHDGMKV